MPNAEKMNGLGRDFAPTLALATGPTHAHEPPRLVLCAGGRRHPARIDGNKTRTTFSKGGSRAFGGTMDQPQKCTTSGKLPGAQTASAKPLGFQICGRQKGTSRLQGPGVAMTGLCGHQWSAGRGSIALAKTRESSQRLTTTTPARKNTGLRHHFQGKGKKIQEFRGQPERAESSRQTRASLLFALTTANALSIGTNRHGE